MNTDKSKMFRMQFIISPLIRTAENSTEASCCKTRAGDLTPVRAASGAPASNMKR
jgi:hypothetical protein